MVKVGIINCGISNLTSVFNAFNFISVKTEIINDPATLTDFSHLVLPGVGSFPRGMDNLRSKGFNEAIVEVVAQGKPLLGICLGMQLLALEGEDGELLRVEEVGALQVLVPLLVVRRDALGLHLDLDGACRRILLVEDEGPRDVREVPVVVADAEVLHAEEGRGESQEAVRDDQGSERLSHLATPCRSSD